jgi:hypothetical protein
MAHGRRGVRGHGLCSDHPEDGAKMKLETKQDSTSSA